MSERAMVRQGDILLIPITKEQALTMRRIAVPRDQGKVVLAYGEVTGHAHVLEGEGVELFETPTEGDRILTIDPKRKDAALRHVDLPTGGKGDHDMIPLVSGDYIVRRQREYVQGASVWVGD